MSEGSADRWRIFKTSDRNRMNCVKADSSNEFERWRLHAANGMDHMLQCVLKIADVAMASCSGRPETATGQHEAELCAFAGGDISAFLPVVWKAVYCGWALSICSHGRRRQIGDMQGTSDGMGAVRSALGRRRSPCCGSLNA